MFLEPLVFLTYLSSPAVSCVSLSTFSEVMGTPEPMVIASPLREPSVEFGGKVERAAGEVECVMEVLTVTESAMEDVVERDVWEPVWRTDGVRSGWVEELDGGEMLAPMRAASWLSEGRHGQRSGLVRTCKEK